MLEKQKKILIIRFSSIGDILLTTPFVKQTRTAFPKAHITYLVKKEFSDLIKYNPNVTDIISFDSALGYKGLKNLSRRLASENFDLVFDLHNNIRSNRLLKNRKGSKIYQVLKNKFRRFMLVYIKINLFDRVLMAPEKYLNVGVTSGLKDNGEKLEIFWDGEKASFIEKLLGENKLIKERYVCIAPGAAHATKMWPIENIIEVIKKILVDSNFKIVLIGGAKEKNLLSEFNDDTRIIRFLGKLSLLETAGVLNQSRGLLTNDSGLMHMAVAVKKPLVAIFGSTSRELGFFPYRADAIIVENENLWCRPCTHIGRTNCPLGHFKCMTDISVEMVYNAVKERIL